jgi:restriction system protein
MIALPEITGLDCERHPIWRPPLRRKTSFRLYLTRNDGWKALEESDKDGNAGKITSDDPKPNTGRLRQAGLTENEDTAWRTVPLDLTTVSADISIVPDELEKTDKERERRDRRHEQATQLYSAFETPWQDLVLDCLLKMKPAAFERLCQRILKDSGFIKVEVTGRSGDGGIDGIGVLRLNLLSFHVFFQCKRWKGSVGASAIRDFRGAMVGRADKGLVMTTGSFTTDARREATRDGAPAIDLVDGETLCELLKKLQIGVSIRKVEHVMVQQEAFLEF